MLKALELIAGCASSAFRIAPKLRVCEWLSRWVHIPAITGALEPGPLDTKRVPPIEGLYDLLAERGVHFFTLAKSARVGGTLFAICVILHKIANSPGPILWVDASNLAARQLFRRELEPFLLACPPVAAQAFYPDRERWTSTQCFFRGGSFLKLAGSGSPQQLAGFQAEYVIINEGDKVHHTAKGEAPAHELAVVRSKQFRFTRKIIENSTPTDEFGPTWKNFLKGSQHYCYVACPKCSAQAGRLTGFQRLTFFPEEKEVPFDEDGVLLPAGQVRIEKTGQFKFDHCRITEEREVEPGKVELVNVGWDYDRAEIETQYQCANGCLLEHTDLPWMLRRYEWRAHNRKAPADRKSAHWWAAFSPFEHWGAITKRYLLALGDPGAMHDVWNNDFGLPFKSVATEVEETDLVRLVKASPHYLLGTIPSGAAAGGFRPEVLTMTVDVQKQGSDAPFWWTIFAWGIAWDRPDWPTVGVCIDYGPAQSWTQIEELAGIAERTPLPGSKHAPGINRYLWRDETGVQVAFQVFTGLVDSGDQAQSEADVYEFCRRNRDVFQPSKGGSRNHCRGNVLYESLVDDKRLRLLWYWSDIFCQTLYRRIIKDRKKLRWLPADLDPEFIDQLTDEHTETDKKGKLVWVARRKRNHLGDCWKMQEVLSGDVEEMLDKIRVQRQTEIEAAAARK